MTFEQTVNQTPVVIEGERLMQLMFQMSEYKKVATIRAVQIPYDFVVVQDADDAVIRGRAFAKAGSWLAMGRSGVFYPISDETFWEQYEPVDEEEERREET